MRYLVLLVVVSAPTWAIETADTIEWEWHGSLSRGKAVEIRGITGDIRAVASDSGQVEVSAKSDTAGVRIRAFERADGITVCAVRAGSDACAEEALSAPGARVNYEVRVPSGVRLSARTVNGAIEAHQLSSDVEAATVNGEVVVSTTGTAQVRTVNGSINASLLRSSWERPPKFSTVNGRISVRMPANVRFGVHAETRNGRVVSKLPGFRGKVTEHTLDGQIGRGGGGCSPMILRTLNGGIELRQKL